MNNTLTRWNPLRELEDFQNRILGAFNPASARRGNGQDSLALPEWMPVVDIAEDDKEYLITAAYLPDRDMQNINVSVEDRTLKIEAKEQELTKKKGDAGTLHSTRKAAYSQLVTLPGPVQSDKMKVEKKEGMLVVTLPKTK